MSDRVHIAIIGGGFSGIGVARELLQAGYDDFVVLEKGSQLGGTWRDNTYPGCACDVPSQLYSFSYAPNASWSRVFAPQPEIQRYLLKVADQVGIGDHVRLDCEVEQATWDEETREWVLSLSDGSALRAAFLVAGAGPLHNPKIPSLPGLEDFEGKAFHTARWDAEADLSGNVAVIGTGSSGIQLVPEIQPECGSLTLFQRTPGWVLPKPDHRIPLPEELAFRFLPGFQKGYRNAWYYGLELFQLAQRSPEVMDRLAGIGRMHLKRQVADPDLRAQLTPDFALSCKRLLLSNTYYPALQQDNVRVVPRAVASFTADGLIDAHGEHHLVDTVIFATGFHVSDPPVAERIVGREGVSLAGRWQGSPTAYLGTSIPGFPNFAMMLGPNLGNGHSSALVLIEAQARYLVDTLRTMDALELDTVEVRAPVDQQWNAEVQEALKGTVWNAGGCASWYLDDQGFNRAIYPWSTLDLRRRLRQFEPAAHHLQGGRVVAITGGAHGIGRATAEAFAAKGFRVAIGDLDQVAAAGVARELHGRAYALDVAERQSFDAFVRDVERDLGPIDVLVNNAGVMSTGAFGEAGDDLDRAMFEVNTFGVLNGMKAVLPAMKARGRGHVVNVASMAGKLPVAGLASYVASKHAVVGLSASVREELEGTGVTLTTILPTAVRTRLAAGVPLGGLLAVDPEDVAGAIVGSWERPEDEIPVPRLVGLAPDLLRALPRRARGLVRRVIGANRVLTQKDSAARKAYEQAIAAGAARAS